MPLQYTYQRPELLGNYSESELNQFASHTIRPVAEPKRDKLNGVTQQHHSLQMKPSQEMPIAGYPMSTKSSYSVCDDIHTVTPKVAQASSLMPLKVLPHGIGYAEAMNAGKSRFEIQISHLYAYLY